MFSPLKTAFNSFRWVQMTQHPTSWDFCPLDLHPLTQTVGLAVCACMSLMDRLTVCVHAAKMTFRAGMQEPSQTWMSTCAGGDATVQSKSCTEDSGRRLTAQRCGQTCSAASKPSRVEEGLWWPQCLLSEMFVFSVNVNPINRNGFLSICCTFPTREQMLIWGFMLDLCNDISVAEHI